MKKIISFIKFFLIGIIWTGIFLKLSQYLMWLIWKFDITSPQVSKTISDFWNQGGVIEGSSCLIFLMMFLLLIGWLWGWRKLFKINFGQALLAPLHYINNRQLRKYEQEDMHVVIKNISIGEKKTVEDVINERIKKEDKPQTSATSQNLRQSISQKIIERKDK